jgi:hypothetical protein
MTGFDNFDSAIIKVVECGYLDATGFSEAATLLDHTCKSNELDKAFTDAWRLFHDSFENNQELFIDALVKTFRQSVMLISLRSLNGAIQILRQLDNSKIADDLLDFYIDAHKNKVEVFDLGERRMGNEAMDSILQEKFDQHYMRLKPSVTLLDAISFIAENNGWSPEHIVALKSASKDDFYRLFKGVNDRRLSKIVRRSLEFQRMEGHEQIGINARAALVRIGKESLLNKERVERYGVEVAPDTEKS